MRQSDYDDAITELHDLLHEHETTAQGSPAAIGVLHDLRGAVDRALHAEVAEARRIGVPWERIGAELGVTRQAAEQRFGGA